MTVEEATKKATQYKAIIFDNDGTIVNSMPGHYIAWRDALKHFGIQFSQKKFYALAGVQAADIIQMLSAEQGKQDEVSVAQVLEHRQERLECVLRKTEKISVVTQILDCAVEHNIPVALASGGERGDVLASLAYADVDASVFSATVTREDITKGKPDPETFLLAASKLGVAPEDCIGLEDADMGLQALDAAGMAKIDVRLIEGYPLPEVLLEQEEHLKS